MITKRRNLRKYIPITIESQQPNGEWRTRNTLKIENDKAKGGDISRDELIAIARKLMILWNCNSDHPISLRIGGVKRPLATELYELGFPEDVIKESVAAEINGLNPIGEENEKGCISY